MARGAAKKIDTAMIQASADAVLNRLARREVDCIEYQDFLMMVAEHLCDANPQRSFNRKYGRLSDLAERIRHRVHQRVSYRSEWRMGDMTVNQKAMFIDDDGEESTIMLPRQVKALRRVKE